MTTERFVLMRGLAILAVTSLALLAPQPAEAQSGGRWTPWLGCWELVQETAGDDESVLDGRRLICMERADDPATVRMTTWLDDEVVLLQEIVADGSDRSVDEGGCAGTESARFSADGQRILMTADLACDGQPLRTSGIGMLPTSSTWADIQVAEVDGQRELLVRRYRRAAMSDRAGDSGLENLDLLMRTARQSAAAPLDADDVIEALDVVDPAAVEAMLLESGDTFPMDAELLIHLAEADVPEGVIDLMVALSFPDYFAVHEPDEEEAWERDRYRRSRWVYGYGSYGAFYNPYASRYYGYPFYYGGYPGRVIVIDGAPRFGGKVVKGRGYTRVTARQDAPSGGIGSLFGGNSGSGRSSVSRGNDGGGSRVATPRSGGSTGRIAKPRSGSGSSTGRTAKPRSGGSSAKPKPKGGGF